jgi:predicted amidohydrolase
MTPYSMKALFSFVLINALLLNTLPGLAQSQQKAPQTSFSKVKIASLSYIPVKWDKESNLKTIEKMATEAVANGAQLLITPEGGLEGYLIDELLKSPEREKWEPKFREIAEPLDGPGVMKVREIARKLGVDLVLGFLERDGNILYNSCAWINPNGEVLQVHRKTQLAEPYFDPEYYHPGYEINAFDTRFGRIGMLICFERQVPEVSTALALDGARILINPSYGSRGEWNDVMLRTRARDNEAYFIFTHPKQTLVIQPDGKIIVNKDDEQGAGIVYAEISLDFKPVSKLVKRRSEAFRDKLSADLEATNRRLSHPGMLKVAAVQMHSSHNLRENVEKICRHLADCARQGVRVAVFPECATTGYFKEDIPGYTEQDFIDAEKKIAASCQNHQIFAVVGTPYYEEGKVYNMALVIAPSGKTIYRQPKINQVGGDKPWSVPGNRLGVFHIDGEMCSAMVCHDSRYPELARLPVIKGSRLVFYISCESGISSEEKIAPYRAQVVARAVENQVFIVQSNTPQKTNPQEGSHGQSRIVNPNGIIDKEASIFEEEVLVSTINLKDATGSTAKRSMDAPFLNDWWESGLKLVEVKE